MVIIQANLVLYCTLQYDFKQIAFYFVNSKIINENVCNNSLNILCDNESYKK